MNSIIIWMLIFFLSFFQWKMFHFCRNEIAMRAKREWNKCTWNAERCRRGHAGDNAINVSAFQMRNLSRQCVKFVTFFFLLAFFFQFTVPSEQILILIDWFNLSWVPGKYSQDVSLRRIKSDRLGTANNQLISYFTSFYLIIKIFFLVIQPFIVWSFTHKNERNVYPWLILIEHLFSDTFER